MTARPWRKQRPELIGGPTTHRHAGDDVFSDRLVQKTLRCDDLAAAGLDIFGRGNAQHPAKVIGVRVRVDHGRHGSLFDMARDQLEACSRSAVGG